MSVMVVKVLLKAWNPVTGPSAGEEEDQEDGGTRREKEQINHNHAKETNCSCNVCPILAR